MTTILFLAFIGPISWFYHPQMAHGHCIAEPGTFSALYCPTAAPARFRQSKIAP